MANHLSASRKGLLGFVAVAAIGSRLLAQAPLAAVVTEKPDLTFEVASVKPNKSDARSSRIGAAAESSRFEAVNMSLAQVIQWAYEVRDFQVAGGPAWLSADKFDIIAKAADNDLDFGDRRRQDQQIRQMVRALLRERFALIAHADTKQLPVYELVMARTDGRFGPELKRTVECAPPADCAPRVASTGGGGGVTVGPGVSGGYTNTSSSKGTTMADLAASLSRFLGRVVVDRTALDGKFDVSLRWNAVESPVIFTAVQEQLGLKLQSALGPVEMPRDRFGGAADGGLTRQLERKDKER